MPSRRSRALAGLGFQRMLVASALAAWLAMLLQGQRLLPAPLCLSVEAGATARYATELEAFIFSPLFGSTLLSWATMLIAMMLPLMLVPAQHIAIRTFADRRSAAFAELLLGYLLIWAAGLAAMLALMIGLRAAGGVPEAAAGATGFVAAAAYQGTKWKRAALKRCHIMADLRAYGWRADFDCVRFGMRQGMTCLASCGAMMLALVLGGHDLAAMAVVGVILFAERYEQRPQIAASQLVLSMLAAIALLRP